MPEVRPPNAPGELASRRERQLGRVGIQMRSLRCRDRQIVRINRLMEPGVSRRRSRLRFGEHSHSWAIRTNNDLPILRRRLSGVPPGPRTRKGAWRHVLSDKGRRARCSWRSRAPNDRRSPEVAPCRSKAPRAFRWRIRSSDPRRWRRQGRPPGTARNRCI